MLLSLQANDHKMEDIEIAHDGKIGFMISIGPGHIHVRAKQKDEPDADKTTLVIASSIEIVK